MNNAHIFSEEQQAVLRSNPYTRRVSDRTISFTLEFKQYVMDEISKPGMTFPKVLRNAGYDPDMFGRSRVDRILMSIRHEAASEKGLHETGPSRQAGIRKDLSKKQTKTAIRDLQEQVAYLEQEIEFLKKIARLSRHP